MRNIHSTTLIWGKGKIDRCNCQINLGIYFDEIRSQFISFVDDLFINLSLIKEQKSLEVSTESEKDFEDSINFYVLCNPSWRNCNIWNIGSLFGGMKVLYKWYFYQTYGPVSLFCEACGIPYLCHSNCESFLFFDNQFV